MKENDLQYNSFNITGIKMDGTDNWIKDELLQAFYSVVNDFKTGSISEEMFKERLLKLAERYERGIGKKELGTDQQNLF
jgi:hypothetical protein